MNDAVKMDDLDAIEQQIAELQKKKILEERKLKLLNQKEDFKRRIIELNLQLIQENLHWEEKEKMYQDIIKTQESLLFINGYYAKLLNQEHL